MPRKKITPTESSIPAGDFVNPSAAAERPPKTDGRPASSISRRISKGSNSRGVRTDGGAPVKERGARQILDSAVSEHEQIALLAYSYWEARGRQGGSPEDDWLRAEREFRGRHGGASKAT